MPRRLLKNCCVSLLFKKIWRPWLLGELGGLKRRLGELIFLGVLGGCK
jgi:hypothetical protein